MKKENVVKILIALAFVLAAGLAIAKSQAQVPSQQLLITWQAKNYAPAGYKGKVLPTAGSRITASFDLIENGKIADLSGQTIYWYLNDLLISNVPGIQTVNFLAPGSAPDVIRLKIQLPFYRDNLLSRAVQIPVVAPEVVIESPYPGGMVNGTSASLKAVPYFFSVLNPSALNFTWSVNGQTAESKENPDELVATINPDARSGSTINVGLTVQNPKNSSEAANQNLVLTFIK